MLEVIKSNTGEIKACLEWYLVDKDGNFSQQGEFVWINEIEISPQYRNNGILREFIRVVVPKVPLTCRFGYFWRRDKYPNRKIRIWHKSQWLRLLNEKKI